jgi:CubicO group peptidase (beta-lactamase class C family)
MRTIAAAVLILACFAPSRARGKEDAPPAATLHAAALQGDLEAVRAHIRAGADLDARDPYGSTPLILATTFGRTEVARALIAAGADLSIADRHGSRPLHLAAFLGRVQILEALLERGADRFARNMEGSTAYDIVAAPFEDDRKVYDQLRAALGPLGLVLDDRRIARARPEMARRLRPRAEDLAAVGYAPAAAGGGEVATPAGAGLDPRLVAELYLDASHLRNLYGLLVVKGGKLVAEGYFHDGSVTQLSPRMSVTKSVLSALFGVARERGCMPDLDARMIGFFPELAGKLEDPRKAQITVRQMLQMRGGYPMELLSPRHHDALFFSGDWNWIPHLVDFPLLHDPGARFQYSNLTSHLLAVLLARACKTELAPFAEKHLLTPIGAKLGGWSTDPDGHNWGWGEIQLTARDMARFGQLYLEHGASQGRQVVPADWVAASLQAYSKDAWTTPRLGRYLSDIGYGYQWWSARVGGRRVDFAWGHGGQLIVLLDDLDMVIVTTADPLIGVDPLREPGWEEELAIVNVVGKFIASLPTGG